MSEWRDIKKAPYQKVIWVKNGVMQAPVLATRGYNTELGVHPDNTFCTSVFTPSPQDFGFPGFPPGNLVCPTHWKEYIPEEQEGPFYPGVTPDEARQ